MATLLYTGKVKFFNAKSHFGFITIDSTNADFYFYIKNPATKFEAGEKVAFNLRQAKKGMEAINVTSIKEE